MLLQIANPIPEEEIISKADSAKVALRQFTELLATDPASAFQQLVEQAVRFGLKIVAAILVYIIGAWVIRYIKRSLRRLFIRRETDKTMASFITSLTSISLTIVLIILTVSTLGVNTTSLAALLAAGGMAIGMALSGTLQNFAGGLMIMAFKPFKAGDYIEALGYAGYVTAVTIVGTHLTTTDNRKIILPNGTLSSGNVINYSSCPLRRIDLTVSMEYGTDAAACKALLLALMREDPRILDASREGAADPFVALQKLNDSSVDFIVRVWVENSDYWSVFFDLNERIYTELPKAGFQFPFPQLDVHVRGEQDRRSLSA